MNAVLEHLPDIPASLRERGVLKPSDALRLIPNHYQDLTNISFGFGSLNNFEPCVISAQVFLRPQTSSTSLDSLQATFEITDGGQSSMVAHAFGANAKAIMDYQLEVGEFVFLFGEPRTNQLSGNVIFYNCRLLSKGRAGRPEPIYADDKEREASSYIQALLKSQTAIQEAVSDILQYFPGETAASLVRHCGVNNGLTLNELLSVLHAPANMTEAKDAQVVIKRLSSLEVVYQAKSLKARPPVPGCEIRLQPQQLASLLAKLPFKLTDEQESAVVALCDSLVANVPTRHLISGDVGTGKTAVFMLIAAAAYLAGAKVVVLAPNLLVVEQHLLKLQEWWPNLSTKRVVGSTNLKPADVEYRPIMVGTTALISRLQKLAYVPDLLIVDEQHKLSTEQREFLLGPGTHYVEATATCIPRTMAVVTHGGMDVSLLRETPFKKTVKTYVVPYSERHKLFDSIKNAVSNGGQVAVIYPRIEARKDMENDRYSFEDALKLWQTKFPGKAMGLHGQMKAEEKTSIIEAMKRREFDILVATTVIEVGVDLPDLRVAVVVEPDRFGLNQLHQIRGRVARHGGKGFFFPYLNKKVEPDTMRRLKVLEEVSDGFRLAERDLALRGFGDLADGSRQTGKALLHAFLGCELDLPSLRAVLRLNRQQ